MGKEGRDVLGCQLRFGVLGPLEVSEGERLIRLGGPRQRALLALLLIRPGQFVAADQLIDELWEGRPPDSAANALRVHITHLRYLLEPSRGRNSPSVRLPAAGSGYRLLVDPDELDSLQLERLVALGHRLSAAADYAAALEVFEEALGLLRGPPFAGVGDVPCLHAEIARLDEMGCTAIEAWSEVNLVLGRHAAVIGRLEAALEGEPLRERFTELLMLALYRCERQAQALRVCATLRRNLREDLGLDPCSAVSALEQSILEHDPALDWAPPLIVSPPREARVVWPGHISRRGTFVGRDSELALLSEELERVSSGAAAAIFVFGLPGVGKTALARTFLAWASETGAISLYGHCDPEPTGPYQPITEAIRGLVVDGPVPDLVEGLGPLGGELIRLVPALAGSVAGPGPIDDSDRYRLFEAVAGLLRSARRPVVMVLDDLQWADRPTILLMRHLMQHPDSGQLLIIGTCRGNQPESNHLLADTLLRAMETQSAHRIDLGGLDPDDVDHLLRLYTPADATPAAGFAEALGKVTGGNPFFIREVIRHLLDHEIGLSRPDVLHSIAPDGVRPLVSQRVTWLSPAARRALQTAAVVGQEFDLPVLAAAARLSDEALLEALEEGLSAGLIVEGPGGVDDFAFSHALVRNAINHDLARSRRARLHLRVGEAMAALGYGEEPMGRTAEVAHHFLEAASLGVTDQTIPYVLAAADAALACLAFEDAVGLCQRGLQILQDADNAVGPATPTARCDLLVRLGRAQLKAGDNAGRDTLIAGFKLARQRHDHRRMGDAVLGLNRGFFTRVGRVDVTVVNMLEEALAAQPPGDGQLVAELMATLGSELVWADDGERRFGLSDEAVGMARRVGSPVTLARVLLLRNMTIAAPDTVAARVAACQELWDVAQVLGDRGVQFQAAFHRSGTAVEFGDIVVANEMVDRAQQLADECRQPALLWQAAFMNTSRRILQGALDEAEQLARATLELGRRANQTGEAFIFYTEQLLEIRRWQDRLDEIVGDVRELAGVDGVDLGYSLMRYLFDSGETEAAHSCYAAIMAKARLPLRRDLVQLAGLGNLAYMASRIGDASGAKRLAAALAPFKHILASTTVAKPAGAHYLGMISASLGDLEAAQRYFRMALEVHREAAAPLLAAETQIEWAQALLASPMDRARIDALLGDAERSAQVFGAWFLQRRGREVRAVLG
jgi:DNA-binding SARP family transcriptional activator